MRLIKDFGRRQRGATLILLTTMLSLVLIPLVGLAIDGTMCYIVQARLSEAADGAALGSGRLLGTSANITEIAGEFLKANFPTSYWGAHDLQTDISVNNTFSSHTVTINASVKVPLLFMRIMNFSEATIGASAVSTRRDTRVELVLDRSASMSGNIGALRTAAGNFVAKFTPGVDELGLVAFGGSAFIAYPTTKTLSSTGPTTHFADVVAGQDNIKTMISSMVSGGDTATAEALYLAWQELKTASTLDADPTRMNAIVLFTDGVPNGITAYFNDPTGTSIKSSSGCVYKTSGSAAQDMKAWMATTGSGSGLSFFSPTSGNSHGVGVYVPKTRDTTQNAKYWDTHASTSDEMVLTGNGSGQPRYGCGHLSSTDLADLIQIPSKDLYGTPTTGNAWNQSLLYTTYGVLFAPATASTANAYGYQVALASWNAVDNVAQRILADNTINVAIYCIGYTGNGGVDSVLLKRIANTLDSGVHNATWQTGMYVAADDSVALGNAFNTVASEILRLAK
jgi:Flp pilus assembly protein TadG